MKNNNTALKKLGTALAYAATPVLLLGSGIFMISYGMVEFDNAMDAYKASEEFTVHKAEIQDQIDLLEASLNNILNKKITHLTEKQIQYLEKLKEDRGYIAECMFADKPENIKLRNRDLAISLCGIAPLSLSFGAAYLEYKLYSTDYFKRKKKSKEISGTHVDEEDEM